LGRLGPIGGGGGGVGGEGRGGGGGGGGVGTGDVPEMIKKILRGSTVLRSRMEICAVCTAASNWILHEDSQYDSVVWRASWLSNFRYRHI